MSYPHLLSPATIGGLHLANHILMAPMTRSRATAGHVPTEAMIQYYADRAAAGLIITEGVGPSANGTGYPRIPGIYTQEMIQGWRKVTDAVHAKGGKIFLQIMHTGRIGHPANMDAGAEVIAPSAVQAGGEMWTDANGNQPHATPRAVATEEVAGLVQEFVTSAKNAIEAGFDGVELHGANGYLIEQFLRPTTNHRTDQYGGSTENYARFGIEVSKAVADAIGKEKTAIRLSPYGVFNDQPYEAEYDAIYEYLVGKLSDLGLLYVHLVDHTSMGAPTPAASIVEKIREVFKGALVLSGGFDADRAEQTLAAGRADLIAIGRPYLANPDLIERIHQGAELNAVDYTTLYTPGEPGYNDYPVLAEVAAKG